MQPDEDPNTEDDEEPVIPPVIARHRFVRANHVVEVRRSGQASESPPAPKRKSPERAGARR